MVSVLIYSSLYTGYGNSFRPIHGVDYSSQTDSSMSPSGNNNYQTLVPTPVRNQRPPLLATPPGLSMLQQGTAGTQT